MSRKKYKYSDYFDSKEKAVKTFLHHSFDTCSAARMLSKYVCFMDSAGFLYHLAYELLIKTMMLYHNGVFPDSHKIQVLVTQSDDSKIFEKYKGILAKVDRMFYHRYPIDSSLSRNTTSIPGKEMELQLGEIGDPELEEFSQGYNDIVDVLRKKYDVIDKVFIEILNQPSIKGDRILMRKKKEN